MFLLCISSTGRFVGQITSSVELLSLGLLCTPGTHLPAHPLFFRFQPALWHSVSQKYLPKASNGQMEFWSILSMWLKKRFISRSYMCPQLPLLIKTFIVILTICDGLLAVSWGIITAKNRNKNTSVWFCVVHSFIQCGFWLMYVCREGVVEWVEEAVSEAGQCSWRSSVHASPVWKHAWREELTADSYTRISCGKRTSLADGQRQPEEAWCKQSTVVH